jgi:hypothetical protein
MAGNITFGSIAANTETCQIPGTTTSDSANAGNIGEEIVNYIGLGTGPSLTTATPANVTSITLTAGDWDVTGHAVLEYTSATQSGDGTASLSQVSATLNTGYIDSFSPIRLTTTTCKNSIELPPRRVTILVTPVIYYLVAQATFSAGTCKVSGYIRARRMR